MLRAMGPGTPLRVAAMIPDHEPWTDEEKATYADLLGLHVDDVEFNQFTTEQRKIYFLRLRLANQDADFFLDPDTGLATSKKEKKADHQHASPAEVRRLLADGNVVAIYQHSRHEKAWLLKSAEPFRDVHVVGCECTHAGMLFVTRSRNRALKVRDALADRLGAARMRVWLLGPRLKAFVREAIESEQITLGRGAEILGLDLSEMRKLTASWVR